jgi:hypothetical protein
VSVAHPKSSGVPCALDFCDFQKTKWHRRETRFQVPSGVKRTSFAIFLYANFIPREGVERFRHTVQERRLRFRRGGLQSVLCVICGREHRGFVIGERDPLAAVCLDEVQPIFGIGWQYSTSALG